MQKNIFLIFGYLLTIALLFMPYKFQDIGGRKSKNGIMFTPIFLVKYFKYESLKNEIFKDVSTFEKFADKEISGYRARSDLLVTELAFILLIGGFAYILFCVVLKRNKQNGSDKKAG